MSISERLATALDQVRCLEDEPTWLKAAGVSQAQMQFVMWVGNHPGCRLQQIAAGLGLTAPTVSVGIRRLEQAGMLQRASDERDQRAINLELTPRGQDLYKQATNDRERSIKILLERLKPGEQRQLVELLERCLGNTVPAPQTLPSESPSGSQEAPTPGDEAQQANIQEGPKQLDLFGG